VAGQAVISGLTIYGRWLNKHGRITYFRDEDGKSQKGWSVPEHLQEAEFRARSLSARKVCMRMHSL